jgi:hypothetical protein
MAGVRAECLVRPGVPIPGFIVRRFLRRWCTTGISPVIHLPRVMHKGRGLSIAFGRAEGGKPDFEKQRSSQCLRIARTVVRRIPRNRLLSCPRGSGEADRSRWSP